MTRRKTVMRAAARARRAWHWHEKAIALSEGIPDSYRQVIMFLYHHPGKSQRSVAEFCEVTTSAISQTVKNMQADGYLRREADPSDRRNACLTLTQKGEDAAKRLHERLESSDEAITALLGAERENELIAALDALTDFIREELHEC